jgi:hypothetical protein
MIVTSYIPFTFRGRADLQQGTASDPVILRFESSTGQFWEQPVSVGSDFYGQFSLPAEGGSVNVTATIVNPFTGGDITFDNEGEGVASITIDGPSIFSQSAVLNEADITDFTSTRIATLTADAVFSQQGIVEFTQRLSAQQGGTPQSHESYVLSMKDQFRAAVKSIISPEIEDAVGELFGSSDLGHITIRLGESDPAKPSINQLVSELPAATDTALLQTFLNNLEAIANSVEFKLDGGEILAGLEDGWSFISTGGDPSSLVALQSRAFVEFIGVRAPVELDAISPNIEGQIKMGLDRVSLQGPQSVKGEFSLQLSPDLMWNGILFEKLKLRAGFRFNIQNNNWEPDGGIEIDTRF